jgi:DNA polymerase-3 subunit delta'
MALSDFKIYGNKQTVELTAQMIRKNREPHSIVIHGEKGLGKKTLAKYIAAQLMCERHDGTPCGVCKSCRMLANNAHPDFIVAQSGEKGNYYVDDIREKIVSDAVVMPNEGDMKVYVIPDFDLSVNTSVQIQNILLKLIEEPPDHAAIILTARSREVFLPTIISRVISLGMVSVTEAESAEFLHSRFPEKPEREIADEVYAGGGNIGRCADYAERGPFFAGASLARTIAAAAVNLSEYEILRAFTSADGKKALLREGLYLFSEIVRDACVLRLEGKNDKHTVSCDRQSAARLSDRLSVESAVKLYDLLCEYIRRIDANCNLTLTANSLAGQIAALL